ncbi:hypothetical protein PoB_007401900 [Plakobranchus ocellatus]|uniref:Uncharacterized protein n=1 Tax=Plakobranchus ocellatus TaxID=259542 RepID=A0AAV4DTG6_9GAST|nr:hypothetical protein PoB_007401900 [Plakobranchus ocellatus]
MDLRVTKHNMIFLTTPHPHNTSPFHRGSVHDLCTVKSLLLDNSNGKGLFSPEVSITGGMVAAAQFSALLIIGRLAAQVAHLNGEQDKSCRPKVS